MFESIAELHDAADRLTAGETIVDLDPATLEGSFVKDRFHEDHESYETLLEAMRHSGQHSPVLVRPHPEMAGRFMIVFGHRRVRAARELGRPVRAVIRKLEDIEHVIAQGQENAVRANLSFIEKAFYAGALTAQRYDNKVIMTALSITASTLSVLQSVAALPPDVLEMLGGAKSTGRNRWYELKRLLDRPALLKLARELVQDADLLKLAPDQRFEAVLKALKQSRRKPSTPAATKSAWQPDSKAFAAEITVAQRRFTLALKAKQGSEAADFGRYLSDRLEGLYRDFRQEETSERKHNR